MTALNKLFLVLFVLLLSCNCYAESSAIQFPNEGKAVVSPNGRYSIYSIENQSGQTNHVLMLEDTVLKKKWLVYKYDRHIDVLWSPQGDKLIINDHALSNQSDCVLYDVNKGKAVSVWKIIERIKNEKTVLSNHHAYISCSQWLTDDRVEVVLSAYGDLNPDGIDKVGEFQFGSSKIKLKIVKK
jgi:hypothetical protein